LTLWLCTEHNAFPEVSVMRLFIAVNFDENIKNELWEISRDFQQYTSQGNFTRPENFHLTLVFLGEVAPERVKDIQQAMAEVTVKPFTLSLGGLGCFKRRNGDIYWIGVELSNALLELYRQLVDSLTQRGFVLENRGYKPHLTLGRQIELAGDYRLESLPVAIKPLSQKVSKISLMLSERINGRLTYTEIHSKSL